MRKQRIVKRRLLKRARRKASRMNFAEIPGLLLPQKIYKGAQSIRAHTINSLGRTRDRKAKRKGYRPWLE